MLYQSFTVLSQSGSRALMSLLCDGKRSPPHPLLSMLLQYGLDVEPPVSRESDSHFPYTVRNFTHVSILRFSWCVRLSTVSRVHRRQHNPTRPSSILSALSSMRHGFGDSKRDFVTLRERPKISSSHQSV